MILSFLFLGWGFYELSGGPNFRPAETPIAAPILVTEAELVTIDQTRLLIADAVAQTAATDSFAAPEIVMRSSMDFTRPAGVTGADGRDGLPELTDVALATRLPEPEVDADLREVAASRLNMRGGPGTGHPVLATLDRGTKVEVIAEQGNWVQVKTGEVTGWMASKLLKAL